MLIAIDYDKTFTAARGLFSLFMGMCKTHQHQVICVTGRAVSDPITDIECPVVYANGGFKKAAAEAAGYNVDVWIDDEPGYIEPCRILDWEK